MTHAHDHIDDEVLSAFVDDQLTPGEATQVVAHLEACTDCLGRGEGLRSVALLLRGLPELSPPRDFHVVPRVVADPPNVVRLRRWYTVSRMAAASLAAVFVLASVTSLYVDSRPEAMPAATVVAPRSAAVQAPAPAVQGQAPAPAPQLARPAAAPQASPPPAAGGAAAIRPPVANPQADDQVAAATSINPLPTPVPTPQPTAAPVPLPRVTAPEAAPAPLRTLAASVGVLAVIALLATLAVRHRLQRQLSQP